MCGYLILAITAGMTSGQKSDMEKMTSYPEKSNVSAFITELADFIIDGSTGPIASKRDVLHTIISFVDIPRRKQKFFPFRFVEIVTSAPNRLHRFPNSENMTSPPPKL